MWPPGEESTRFETRAVLAQLKVANLEQKRAKKILT